MQEYNKEVVAIQVNKAIVKIGDTIRKKRIEMGISQQTLAFYLLSDKSLISEIERGHARNITLLTLFKIANVLEMDIKEFL